MSQDWPTRGSSDRTSPQSDGDSATGFGAGDDTTSALPPPPPVPSRTSARRSLKKSDDGAAANTPISEEKPAAPPAPTRSAASSGARAQRSAGASRPGSARPTGARQARLMLYSVNPWSVMKLAFLLSIALGIVGLIATILLWSLLDGMHVFAKMEELLTTLGSEQLLSLMDFVRLPRVMSLATLIGVINIVLLTALSTIGAFLYNITSALVGGIHVTFTDD